MNDCNPPSNRRILVVDDNRAIHDDFRKILDGHRAGNGALEAAEAALFGDTTPAPAATTFEIDSAFQGREGLERVQQAAAAGQPYAVAFVDVRMPPGWDGIETTLRLWQVDPDLQIVICTAYSDYSWEEMSARVGPSDRLVILKKPFDNIEVAQLAQALTSKWQLARQACRKANGLEEMIRERTAELTASNEKLLNEIIEHKSAEAALRKSEARYRELVNNLGEGVVFADAENHFTFANPAAESIFGVWPGQLIGKKLGDFLAEQDRPAFQQQLALRRAGQKSRYEVEIIAVNGEHRQLLVIGTPQINPAGRFRGTFAVLHDITRHKQVEQALRESQRLQKAILDNIPDPAWLKDNNGRYLIGNKSLSLVFQRRLEEIIGKTVSDILPQHAAKLSDGENLVNPSGQPVRSEQCLPDDEGRPRWFDTIEAPVRNEQGDVTGTIGIARDITERKQVEEELRRKNALFEALIQSSPDGILVVDGQGRKIVQNPQLNELLKIPAPIAEQPEDTEQLAYVINSTKHPAQFEEKVRHLYAHPEKTSRDEIEFKDGRTLDRYTAPIVCRPDKYCGRIWIFRDVTTRKRAEKALQESERRFREMLENMDLVAMTLDQNGLVTFCNDFLLRLTGWNRGEVLGNDWFVQFIPESAPAVKTIFQESFRSGSLPRHYENPIKTRTGQLREIAWSNTVLRDMDGNPIGTAGIGEDITERKQAEQALRESEMLLREMGRTAKIGGWELNPRTGEGRWTDEVARIHDLDPSVQPNRAMGTDYYHGPSRTLIEIAVQEAIDHGTPYDLELEIISATGRHKWVRTICEPVVENGKVVKLRGSFQDITERKLTEKQLRLQTSALEAAANGRPAV